MLVAIACAVIDLASKTIVFQYVPERTHVDVIPGYFRLDHLYNTGGLWSLGAGEGNTNLMLACFMSMVILGIVTFVFVVRGLNRTAWSTTIVLGMIVGGAIGNLYDRIVFRGVRDFITVHYLDYYWYPTFNVADSFLVCSAVFLMLRSFLVDAETPEAKAAAAEQRA